MIGPTTGRWRTARAGAFALLAAQIAVFGHVIAGGSPPGLTLLAAMSALLVGGLRGLCRQRRSFRELLTAMAGTQVVFHLMLTLAGSGHDPGGPHGDHPLRMLVYHAAVAMLTAALLAHGEQLLFALHGWISRLVPQVTPPRRVAPGQFWVAMLDRRGHEVRDLFNSGSLSRRGPPAAPAPVR